MTQMTSFFVVEFTDTEPYSYWGPPMYEDQWESFIKRLRGKAEKEIEKEMGHVPTIILKFRLDKFLKERGFFRHNLPPNPTLETSNLELELDNLVLR